MTSVIFDVETEPLSDIELLAIMPPFDPDDVALGNRKDPDKIKSFIEERRISYERDFFEEAALYPETGRVLAVGVHGRHPDAQPRILSGQEDTILREFWALCADEDGRPRLLVGWNIDYFDLPFLIKRSWKLGIRIPNWTLTNRGRRGSINNETCLDLAWMYTTGPGMEGLDKAAKFFGLPPKLGKGKDFHKLWNDPKTRKQAEAYLMRDLEITNKVYDILCPIT